MSRLSRRSFLVALAASWAGMAKPIVAQSKALWQRVRFRFLRPPGALAEPDFVDACIRCGLCAEVCPNQCIKFFNVDAGLKMAQTPYIIPRQKSCILCMQCGQVCPTQALKNIPRKAEPIVANVNMGQARVDTQLCLSYQGKTCGVCYRACPLPDVAIKAGRLEQPIVTDKCVGCGLCERSCIQLPQAIKIIPAHMQNLAQLTTKASLGEGYV